VQFARLSQQGSRASGTLGPKILIFSRGGKKKHMVFHFRPQADVAGRLRSMRSGRRRPFCSPNAPGIECRNRTRTQDTIFPPQKLSSERWQKTGALTRSCTTTMLSSHVAGKAISELSRHERNHALRLQVMRDQLLSSFAKQIGPQNGIRRRPH